MNTIDVHTRSGTRTNKRTKQQVTIQRQMYFTVRGDERQAKEKTMAREELEQKGEGWTRERRE
jgi:hypothetical protein